MLQLVQKNKAPGEPELKELPNIKNDTKHIEQN